jgi:hypothetical protein
MSVHILEAMLAGGWLAAAGRDFTVTAVGAKKLDAMGIDLAVVGNPRRVFARACVDLTQRPATHLGGALGQALLELYSAKGWIRRRVSSRIVDITSKGQENFRRVYGVGVHVLRPPLKR